MEIEIRIIKITKSKIQQMEYIGVPNSNVEVLGWVNLDKKRWVIIKKPDGSYNRTDFITEIIKEEKSVQFSLPTGGYEFPILTNIKCVIHGIRSFSYSSYSPERDENKNIKLYDDLILFKRKTHEAGQIYY